MKSIHPIRGLRLLSALAAAVLLTITSSGAAAPETWRVEVSVVREHADGTDPAAFEQVVRHEIGQLDFDAAYCPSQCVLSTTLVSLATVPSGDVVTASCSVSAAVRERRSGSLRAVIRGRAQASGGKVRVERTRQAAMEAAVHSALSRLEAPRP